MGGSLENELVKLREKTLPKNSETRQEYSRVLHERGLVQKGKLVVDGFVRAPNQRLQPTAPRRRNSKAHFHS
jgi:hypothetical protein